MRAYSLPKNPRLLIFDIDNTLYDNKAYAQHQLDVIVERLAAERGVEPGAAWAEINSYRKRYRQQHGATPSLGNTFVALGIPHEQTMRWREEDIEPERYLDENRRLRRTLDDLKAQYRLLSLTNNPVSVGRRALACMGVEECFELVIGSDEVGVSKPSPAIVEYVLSKARVEAGTTVSIGDRYAVDIEPFLAYGAGGILVESMSDVYKVRPVLENAAT